MYSTISSKIYIVKKIMSGSVVLGGWDQNLQICHAATSAPRVNQGVEPWVSQRPLARWPEARGLKSAFFPFASCSRASRTPTSYLKHGNHQDAYNHGNHF